jgi:hypothetical protein
MRFILLFAVAFMLTACEDEVVQQNAPPPNQSMHDTLAIHNPPAAGGSLEGSWKYIPTWEFGSTRYWLTQQGLRGYQSLLYFTDLRVDGSRVWFEAYEIGTASEKIWYNGTKSDSLITGWACRQHWSSSVGFYDVWEYYPVEFRRE